MVIEMRWSVEARDACLPLLLFEPTRDELTAAAQELAAFYNEAHNRAMMAHTEVMTPEEVVKAYEASWSDGGRVFLLESMGRLMGDADLRHIRGGDAEFAIMIGERGEQKRGLGTRFALMAHSLAFGKLGLERIYVTILPANAASLGLFRKLGYRDDDSAKARSFADDEHDVSMSIDRATFERLHQDKVRGWAIRPRA